MAHVPSLEAFASEKFPIFKLGLLDAEPKEFRHITSTATCYSSVELCPKKFRPEKKQDAGRDYDAFGKDFAITAVNQGLNKWLSDGAAGIYCSCRGLPYVVSKLEAWHPQIDQHLERIFYQMRQEADRLAIGEADKIKPEDAEKLKTPEERAKKERDSWYGPNAYHTFWTLELLKVLERFKEEDGYQKSEELKYAHGRVDLMHNWARQQLGFQVALHSVESSLLDTDQLAWALSIVLSRPERYQSTLTEQDFIRQSFACLFSTQERVGTWRHYGPLFHYPNAGNAYCYVFETFATLLSQALKPEAEFVRSTLKSYFRSLVALWEYAKSTQTEGLHDGHKIAAWASGHRNKPVRESWATASVFAYVQAFRKLLGIWTREEALLGLNHKSTVGSKEKGASTLVQRSQIWGREDLADHLWAMFVNPIRIIDTGNAFDPDLPLIRDDFSCSAIFFGPPGTSKTSLVSSIAEAIGWTYVELHPSHFVAEGLPNVQHTADLIFKRLMELDHTVVLFDEIDELVRERDIEPDQFGRFLTTSMLPRLAELWRARKIMYFVATNHIEYFDRAVTRSERFDAIVFISPPSLKAKENRTKSILKSVYGLDISFAKEITEALVEKAMPSLRCEEAEKSTSRETRQSMHAEGLPQASMLAKLALLRWDELNTLALNLSSGLKSGDVVDSITLEKALAKINDSKIRPLGEYCRFTSDRVNYERFDTSRTAVWLIEEFKDTTQAATPIQRPLEVKDNKMIASIPVGLRPEDIPLPGYSLERITTASPGAVRLRKMLKT